MCERAYDYGGELADDWCYHLVNSKEAKKALNESIKRWAKKHIEPINFYSVTKCKEYILTKKDFEE